MRAFVSARVTAYVVIFVGLLLTSADVLAQEAFDYQVVARPGSPAAVPPIITGAIALDVDAAGRVLFSADGGLLLSRSDGPAMVIAAPGDEAPGGGKFVSIGSSSMNDAGDVAFTASLTPTGQGLFRYSAGTLEAVLRDGAAAPWGGVFRFFDRTSINGHGDIAFTGSSLTEVPQQSRFGIYLYSNGSVSELFQGVSSGFSMFRSFISVRLNDSGQVAFLSSSDYEDPYHLHLISNGQLTHIAGPGVAKPGGGTFSDVSSASLNNLGDVAFTASFGTAVYLWSGGVTTVVSHVQNEALGPGSSFGAYSVLSSPSINDSRQVAFDVVGASAAAVFLWEGGAIRRVAFPGDLIGAVTLRFARGPSLNADGGVAFTDRANIGAPTAYLGRFDGISRAAGPGDAVDAVSRFTAVTTSGVSGVGGAFIGTTFPGNRAVFDVNGARRIWDGLVGPVGDVVRSFSSVSALRDGGVGAAVTLESGKTALWVVRGTDATEIIRSDDLSPAGGPLASLGNLSVNAAADAVFLFSAGETTGIYFIRQRQVTTIARAGDPAPSGDTFRAFFSTSLNDSGDVAFIASETLANRQGLWLWKQGQVFQLVRRGDPAPGGGTFGTFSSAGNVSINNNGDVVFQASVTGGASGVFVIANGLLLRVVVDGQPVTSAETISFPTNPSLSEQGDVVFRAAIRNGAGQVTPSAVFIRTASGIQMVAGPGTLEAELGAGATFDAPLFVTPRQVMFTGAGPTGLPGGVFVATRRQDDGGGQSGGGDVGDVGASGSSFADGSTVIVRGSGADIWGSADAFYWRYTAVTGDFDVSAIVTNIDHIHDWTKAGLMIRENLSPGSPHMFLFATPTATNGVAFQRRLVVDQATLHTGAPSVKLPVWLMLSRRGNTVSAWYQQTIADRWTLLGVEYAPDLPSTVLVGQAVTSHVAGVGAAATFRNVDLKPVSMSPASADVGQVGAPGSLSTSSLFVSMRGSGADVWRSEDAFHWSPMPFTGNFDAVVQVAGVERVHEWTKAGLMIRASADPAAAHVSLFATGGNGLAFQRRVAHGGISTHTAGPAYASPVWIKLSRRGNTLSAAYRLARTDAWTLIGVDSSDAFGETVLVGLAVTSHVEVMLATALFRELEVGAAKEFASADIGNVTAPGTTEENVLRTRLTNAGADIWGTADAFRYHYTTWSGNGRIIARVLSLDATDPWAKAGVMFRQSLDADSPYVHVLLSADQGISLQYRGSVGGGSAQVNNVPKVPGGWIRLTRTGNTFVAEFWVDRVFWGFLGSVNVPMAEHAYVGLAVTSHNESAVTAAEFEDVSVRVQ